MVFGLLIFGAVPTIPTVIGVSKAINAKDDANARGPIEEIEESEEEQKERLEKFNLRIYTESSSSKAKQVDGKYVYLKNGKVYVDSDGSFAKDRFEGFYIGYPGLKTPKRGLVSMVYPDNGAPTLNWVYADRDTYELKHGTRGQSVEHLVGSWDWTEDDHTGMLFEGEERVVAVEEKKGLWALYLDMNDDREKLPKGKRILDVSLERKVLDDKSHLLQE